MNNPTSNWSDPTESNRWFQQHIQIWQKRASYIRQEWAKQAAKQASQQVTQRVTQQVTQPVKQLVTQQKKNKRNEKTRQQYKRRTLHQANTETITEKSSNSQAISTKNTGTLSRIPRQIVMQDSHNTEHMTTFWPTISGIALI